MSYRRCTLAVALVMFALAFAPAAALAQDGPRKVQDDAKLFGDKAIGEANAIIAKIKDKLGSDLVIETKEKGAPDLETAGKLAIDRAGLLASESKLDGVYIIITKEPRTLQVQLIKGKTGGLITIEERNELAKILRSNLGKDRDDALLKVAQRTFEIMTERAKDAKVAPPGKPDPIPTRKARVVLDDAELFGKDAIDEANAIVAKIMDQHSKDLFIETVKEGPVKADAVKWANGRYNDAKVEGVYIVIAKKPGYFRIVVGKKTLEKTFTKANISELEKILAAKQASDKSLTQAANYVLETMNKVSEAALKEIKYIKGDWVGPAVEVAGKEETIKARLMLQFGASGAEPIARIGFSFSDGGAFMPLGKPYRIELKDDGKARLVLRGADAGKDLVLTYEVSDDDVLMITAPRPIAISRIRGGVDLSGNWKRPAKKE
ncbi:MAG: TPM domain-containing protein [Planctomycetes bacterium]|nr:TPM domain-containing protein [Planctomycetota bacterium]